MFFLYLAEFHCIADHSEIFAGGGESLTDYAVKQVCELAPLADNLDGVFLPGLLVRALSADGEAALSQGAVLQVHFIAHVERRVLSKGMIDQEHGVR